MKMRSLFITTASFALTSAVVANAWIQKKQFYPTVVYLTKSSPCVAVLYVQVFVFVFLLAKLLRKIFFGQLRPAETEHLIERSWYAITDTCLAFTMFRDDFSPMFVAAFTLLLFLKCFHWLIEDRVDYMERSPIISFVFKLRVLSLLAILLACDIFFVNLSYHATVTKGASVQLVFGFEYAILATIVMTVFLKYVLHAIDLQSENPWENKAVFMLYVELITGFLRVLLYVCFTILMIKVHTFPLFSIRPMYLTMRQFKKAITDIVLSRRAIRNMNTLYPDATPEELSSTDRTCIICRDDMQAPNPDNPPAPGGVSDAGVNKKLPCGHIFHASCLRSWFQRQQTCPTCRLDVLQARTPAPPERQAPPPPGAPQPPHPGNNPFAQMFHPMMFPRPPPPPPQPANGGAPPPTASSSSQSSSLPPPPPASSFPMGMFMPPPFMPPPVPPPNFSGMTEEQIRLMEGQERRNVEARIECLRNINNLLDAAMQQVAQYVTVVQAMGGTGLQIPPMPSMSQTSAPAPPETGDASASSDVAGPSNATATIHSTGEAVETATGPDPPLEDGDDVPADPDELRKRRLAKFTSKSSENSETNLQ